jgi:hypothetical protein
MKSEQNSRQKEGSNVRSGADFAISRVQGIAINGQKAGQHAGANTRLQDSDKS